MNNRNIRSYAVVLVTTFSLLGLACGCSDDDPVVPALPAPAAPLAVSPDSLMSLWQSALVDMDSTSYAGMYDPGFLNRFSPGDQADFELTTDYMTTEETVHTGWRMFSGEGFTNWLGAWVPGVSRISFPQMTQETPWTDAGKDEPFYGAKQARFTMQMHVERGNGVSTLAAAGSYDFYALAKDTVLAGGDAQEYFQWIGMTGIDPDKVPPVIHTWGGVNLTYLTNEDPAAAFSVADVGGSPLPVWRCDAAASSDTDSGLHLEPYRWKFESGGEWTEWMADPVTTYSYPTLGDKSITLMVRDRWGTTDTQEQEVRIGLSKLPFPDTPAQLMDNFQYTYESGNTLEYLILMAPEFLTILQMQTVEEFPEVGTTLGYDEESRIHQRLFSGEAVTDPDGDLIPGVERIAFSRFQALDAWVETPVEDLFPGTEWAPYEVEILLDRGLNFSTLKVNGLIKFYVTSRDSLHQGSMKKYYQMAGQVDLTGGFKGVEDSIWGSVKALWR
jgi:hypothetical protein